MDNKEAIEYLKWIRPIRPYSLDKIKVQESIDLAINALEGRQQGEWVLMYCSCGDRYYTCSICNRAIEVENGQSLKDYPFCHCGASMKGGAE